MTGAIYARQAGQWFRVTLCRNKAEVRAVRDRVPVTRVVVATSLGFWITTTGEVGDPRTEACITIQANQMSGAPCLRGLRIPVVTIARLVDRKTPKSIILNHYPDLTVADIDAAVAFAHYHQLDLTDRGLALLFQPNKTQPS